MSRRRVKGLSLVLMILCANVCLADLRQLCTVVEVVDGDTIRVQFADKSNAVCTVRLLGIDTPELVHPTKPIEHFAQEASKYTKSKLLNKEIYLVSEVGRSDYELDRYGRLLAYVYLADGSLFNGMMVKEGFAKAYMDYPFYYRPEFRQYEQIAKESGLGMWAIQGQDVQRQEIMIPAEATANFVRKESVEVKPVELLASKYVASKNSNVFHLSTCSHAGRIKTENIIRYSSEDEARAAGKSPCTNCMPGKAVSKVSPSENEKSETVYITNSGTKYHRSSCSSLKKSRIPISKKDAISRGYGPCSRCRP